MNAALAADGPEISVHLARAKETCSSIDDDKTASEANDEPKQRRMTEGRRGEAAEQEQRNVDNETEEDDGGESDDQHDNDQSRLQLNDQTINTQPAVPKCKCGCPKSCPADGVHLPAPAGQGGSPTGL